MLRFADRRSLLSGPALAESYTPRRASLVRSALRRSAKAIRDSYWPLATVPVYLENHLKQPEHHARDLGPMRDRVSAMLSDLEAVCKQIESLTTELGKPIATKPTGNAPSHKPSARRGRGRRAA